MSKLLSIAVAAAFAVASFTAAAQSKDVTDKKGGTVTTKRGEAVTTKAMKDKPKMEPKKSAPRAEAPKPPKEKGAQVKTKRGEAVTTKKGEEIKSGKK